MPELVLFRFPISEAWRLRGSAYFAPFSTLQRLPTVSGCTASLVWIIPMHFLVTESRTIAETIMTIAVQDSHDNLLAMTSPNHTFSLILKLYRNISILYLDSRY